MKRFLIFACLLLIFSTTARAEDQMYTIQDIWTEIPHEGCCPTLSEAYAINDAGYVVGRLAEYPGQFGSPFIWKDGSFLAPPSSGGGFGGAIDINNSNEVTGYSYGPSPYHENTAFFYDIDTGITTSIPFFIPNSMDSTGRVYGMQIMNAPGGYVVPESSWKDGSFTAPSTNSEPHSPIPIPAGDLKLRLAPGYDPLWGDLVPLDINSSGQIVGHALYGQEGDGYLRVNHAFVMTPVVTPEPGSMLLFGLGGAVLAFKKRRKQKLSR